MTSAYQPTLRFDQVSGTLQTWDLSGDDTGFALRDVTAGLVPMTVEAAAPDDSLVLTTGGQVGLGTDAPQSALHILRSDNSGSLLIEDTGAGTLGQLILRNNGITFFTLEDTSIADVDYSGRKWNFQNQNGTFRVTTPPGGAGEIEMLLEPINGNMTIRGELFTGGSCAAGCDAVFDGDYPLPAFAEQMAMIRENGHLPNVGPTDEDGPYNLSKMSTGMLNELEKAYLYIDQLHDENVRQSDRMSRMMEVIADLTTRLERLEPGRQLLCAG